MEVTGMLVSWLQRASQRLSSGVKTAEWLEQGDATNQLETQEKMLLQWIKAQGPLNNTEHFPRGYPSEISCRGQKFMKSMELSALTVVILNP